MQSHYYHYFLGRLIFVSTSRLFVIIVAYLWLLCIILDYFNYSNLVFFVLRGHYYHYFLGRWIIYFHFKIICDYCCIFVIIMHYFRLF